MNHKRIAHANQAFQATTPLAGRVLQRKCACGQQKSGEGTGLCGVQKKRSNLQRKAADHSNHSEVPSIVDYVLRTPGQPLDQSTRKFMEPRFGHDFSQVRVHMDEKAADSAKAVNALAYTVGTNVVFDAGQYTPMTSQGKRLLAHELTHVMQQTAENGTRLRRTDNKKNCVSIDNKYEKEADRLSDWIMTPSTVPPPNITLYRTPFIARQERGAQPAQQPNQQPSCTCSPLPHPLCDGADGARHASVVSAFRTAAGWLPNAKQAIEEYIQTPPNQRVTERAATPLQNHFRWPPSGSGPLRQTPNVVLGVMDRLLNHHFSDPVCPHCPEECPCSGQEPWACSPNAWKRSNCYTFCEPFFSNPSRQAHIAIHEMMHSWEDKGDVAYEGDPNYPPNATTAQENADSFAALIRDLG